MRSRSGNIDPNQWHEPNDSNQTWTNTQNT